MEKQISLHELTGQESGAVIYAKNGQVPEIVTCNWAWAEADRPNFLPAYFAGGLIWTDYLVGTVNLADAVEITTDELPSGGVCIHEEFAGAGDGIATAISEKTCRCWDAGEGIYIVAPTDWN